jgi:ABC-type cobalamin/Fe3+-siderophores transport system ATPase subunit
VYITSIQVHNFKSYLHSSVLDLKPGFNVIAGKNNAGKTALLEAHGMVLKPLPHRSLQTKPTVNSLPDANTYADISVCTTSEDVRTIVSEPSVVSTLMLPKKDSQLYHDLGFKSPPAHAREGHEHAGISLSRHPSFGLYEMEAEPTSYVLHYAADAQGAVTYSSFGTGGPSDIGIVIAGALAKRIFSFKAERFNSGICRVGPSNVLASNANNLAEVLSNLAIYRSRMKQYNETVSRILPDIREVFVRNIQDQQVEIFIHVEDPNLERIDLAVPLNQSGTGVGQILAILYVVLYSETPQVILIDEPQSFLHPGAVRKLIEVLKEHPQHQYILTTHSPTVITAANPSTLTLIKREGAISDFQPIDPKKNEQLHMYLREIGASLSDVFGADDVLWVEGPTEEACFPLILEQADVPLMGTAIVGVINTGDFGKKNEKIAKIVFGIYGKLSQGQSLLPRAIGFVFDEEGLSRGEQQDIQRRTAMPVEFLRRRLYENYLLNPSAIAAVSSEIVEELKENDGFRQDAVTEEEISAWISAHKDEEKYYPSGHPSGDWLVDIHGARLLQDLFLDLFDGRCPYEKTKHSEDITRVILQQSPAEFRDVVDLLTNILKRARTQANSPIQVRPELRQ